MIAVSPPPGEKRKNQVRRKSDIQNNKKANGDISMEIKKSGIIAIVGRPNVGKSTLINRIIGEKIAIVTAKPQTTRNRIYGVLNRDDTQIVFMDTPGLLKPGNALGNYMVKVVHESVIDVDGILLMVEPGHSPGKPEEILIGCLKTLKSPVILLINKIDQINKAQILPVIEEYRKLLDFYDIIPISAKNGDGIDTLLDTLRRLIPEGPALFPEGAVSDMPEKQMIAEIIREKMLILLEREVPHGVAVEIERFSERENGIMDINAVIYCEKESHKGIIIGKRGAMLKKIGELARCDIERFLGGKVFLETWVKIKENWRDNEYLIRNFGFEV